MYICVSAGYRSKEFSSVNRLHGVTARSSQFKCSPLWKPHVPYNSYSVSMARHVERTAFRCATHYCCCDVSVRTIWELGGGGGRAHYHYPVGLTDCDDKYGGRTEHLTNLVHEPRYIRTDVRRGVCRDVTMLISAGRRAGSSGKVLRHYRAGGRCVGAMSVDRSVLVFVLCNQVAKYASEKYGAEIL